MTGGRTRRLASILVHWLDRFLRRQQGIYDYSAEDNCLLRIRIIPSSEDVTLSDGTELHRGDPIAELHVRNEHWPRYTGAEPDLNWAWDLYRRTVHSLEDLAAHLDAANSLGNVHAICGTTSVTDANQRAVWSRTLSRLGFEIVDLPRPGFWGRLHRLGEDILIWGLVWTANPESLRGKGLVRQRLRCWMSRRALGQRYARRCRVESGTADS